LKENRNVVYWGAVNIHDIEFVVNLEKNSYMHRIKEHKPSSHAKTELNIRRPENRPSYIFYVTIDMTI